MKTVWNDKIIVCTGNYLENGTLKVTDMTGKALIEYLYGF